MNFLLDKYNKFADKVVGGEIEYILKPAGSAIADGAKVVCEALTASMPEIGAGITIICAVGIMLTGNAPKWLARWGLGMMGAIIWLINA